MPFTPTLDEHPTPDQIREQLLGAGEYLGGIQRTALADRPEGWQADAESAIDAINHLDPMLAAYERSAPRVTPTMPPIAGLAMPAEDRTAGEQFIRSAAFADRASHNGLVNAVPVSGLIERALTIPTSGTFGPVAAPVLPRMPDATTMRGLVTVVGTGLNSVPYFQMPTRFTDELGANVVAQGQLKPEVTINPVQVDAPTRWIAGWIPVPREVLDDEATVRGWIDGVLGNLVLTREMDQILNGTGTAPQLRGIRNTVGIRTQAAIVQSAGPPVVTDRLATIGLAMGQVELEEVGGATGVVMHPTTFWTLVTTRQANRVDVSAGEAILDPNSVNASVPPGLWGTPVIRTRRIPVDRALAGVFNTDILWERQQVIIRVDEYTLMTTNVVRILAEERVAFGVPFPGAHCEATLA